MKLSHQMLQELKAFHIKPMYESYALFGAHVTEMDGEQGVLFLVWAPNAKKVSLVGSFNYWNDGANPMEKVTDTGVWGTFFKGITSGEVYKYKLFLPDGRAIYKADPYAFYSEVRPETSSVVFDLDRYEWCDDKWLEKRKNYQPYDQPVNIYEVHLGSWDLKEKGKFDNETFKSVDPNAFYSYREIAEQLIPYLKDMHYNFIELLPLMEHPFDGSWGYQVTGYYSMTSRYGTPEDLMYLIDQCHQNGIGVIFDWVPGHFCRDEHGLMFFDGTELYGGVDHPNWGTKKFNFYKSEVRNFLISNARFLFEKYHIDGIRVDGATSILQLNFGMEGEPYRNEEGGTDDLWGIQFLKELNLAIFKDYPFAIMAAEESTSWPMVTHPVEKGGLGFNYKWKMGWMNDSLDYIELDPLFRKGSHDKITFSMHYGYSENFILPFSHDEVVHGKKSLIDKSSGDYNDKFRTLKLLMLYQMTHPGKKLNFMGNEIGQFIEWRYYEPIERFLLDYPKHDEHKQFNQALNKLYLQEKALFSKDHDPIGFKWIDADNRDQSIYIYERKHDDDDWVIVVLNFTPVVYDEFRLGVETEGEYRVLFSTEALPFRSKNYKYTKSDPEKAHGFDQSITVKLPGLSGLIIKKKKLKKK
jgi:1,4-alpha-glucan branching enzyme